VIDAEALAEVRDFRSIRPDPAVPLPTSIEIPSIGVTSGLQRLGRDADGAIEIPNEWQVAGWYAEGVRPGQVGPAVIVGHVDSKQGPAVFYRLREMRRGDKIKITRRDGSVVTFVVDRLEQHAKTRFPTDDVYLPTLEPALRLVTCDGTFDRSTGHYRDNLVVFAHLRG
jgi:sortase (surface protein transpeptidase)